jgi:signal transduction histidine kinase
VIEVRVQGERSLPLEFEQPLFRVAQEALANIARHSGASTVNITLVYANGDINLTVSDDGRGFDVDSSHNGYGLSSMQERVSALGGTLTVESLPDNGTTVSCIVPVTESRENHKEGSHG